MFLQSDTLRYVIVLILVVTTDRISGSLVGITFPVIVVVVVVIENANCADCHHHHQ
jgi:hypothetical protein